MSLGRFSSIADFSTLARASDNRTFREHPLTGHCSASLREGRADTEHPPRPLSYGFFTAARVGTGGSSRSSARTSPDAGRSRSRLKVVSLRFSDQQSLFSSDRDCKGNGIDFNSNLAILRVVRPCGNQLRVWWRWHRREQHSDCSNVWLAAFKASTEIERAELILVGPDRSIATAYGDEGTYAKGARRRTAKCQTQDSRAVANPRRPSGLPGLANCPESRCRLRLSPSRRDALSPTGIGTLKALVWRPHTACAVSRCVMPCCVHVASDALRGLGCGCSRKKRSISCVASGPRGSV